MEDTIFALSSAPGQAGIAVVRVSGQEALPAAQATMPNTQFIPKMLTLGKAVDASGQLLDVCMGVYMPGPATYTGEDVVEFHLHGSPVLVERMLQHLAEYGLRPAGPGEFTQRAFLNGKMDLSQAEAVMDVIGAQSQLAAQAALKQLTGSFAQDIEAIQDSILEVDAGLIACMDFPDSVDEQEVAQTAKQGIGQCISRIQALLATFIQGQRAQQGVRVVVAGQPNVGKSTLFNAFAGEEKAIVTDIPGTTRDRLEVHLQMEGMQVILIDTAGQHDAGDTVERIGVQRAQQAMQQADITLLVVDAGQDATEDKRIFAQIADSNPLVVVNKSDMQEEYRPWWPKDICSYTISAKHGIGLGALREALAQRVREFLPAQDSLLLTNVRHKAALEQAEQALEQAGEAIDQGVPLDLVEMDIRQAYDCLGSILGKGSTQDLLDAVFSRFCIGK